MQRVHNVVIQTRHEAGLKNKLWRIIMWTTPAATEMRFGFEVTMYVMNK
jgi:pyrroloquinoline quinone biosynthesis protein A